MNINSLLVAELILFLVFWFTPFVALSRKTFTSLLDKTVWLIASVFFSWLALMAYFLLSKERQTIHDKVKD